MPGEKKELHSSWNTLQEITLQGGKVIKYYSLPQLEVEGVGKISKLPFSIRIVIESLLRNMDGKEIFEEDVIALANWNAKSPVDKDIPFKVSRVLMQDFTGVPAVVDLAAIREYVTKRGKDPKSVEPLMKVDLIIDHSVQVDAFRVLDALQINQKMEMERNIERYKLLKWASEAFENFRVFPPSAGICHQVNLEYLATCVDSRNYGSFDLAFPDTLVGTDSHTTMIDGLGIVGFGVGGIEAEAALLNQPVSFTTPRVFGVKLTGRLNEGVTATDLALEMTRMLREANVVGAFVEFFGEGVKELSLPDRATISNMCPEYGATISIFPVDDETLNYLRNTGRSEDRIELIRRYYEAQRMLDIDYNFVEFSSVMELDLGSIVPSVSGPSNPKQTVPLGEIASTFSKAFINNSGHEVEGKQDDIRLGNEAQFIDVTQASSPGVPKSSKASVRYEDGTETTLANGDVVIAAITSCTNTSNPMVMIGAGLLAKKAVERGLTVPRNVKTSLAPGSRVVTAYLDKAGLIEPLYKLGFELVGYGCTTCIGNSGPLPAPISKAIVESKISVASVLSGNRNYESRIHSEVSGNYLMSPALVVAFAIAGTVMKDLTKEPLGIGNDGNPVYLKDIWPSQKEIGDILSRTIDIDMFHEKYKDNLQNVNDYWNGLEYPHGLMYKWGESSTYIQLPPFFENFEPNQERLISPLKNARVLALFGDSVSTDHISPAGAISQVSPAGKYLIEHGIAAADFNTYGSRRGNDKVMVRGTFANNRIKNLLVPGVDGGYTLHFPDGENMSIYDAAMKYKTEGISAIVIAGIEYGSGSSRDWAAKGPMLMGVKAVIAKSFERIHRSNLIGMGIMPLQFENGEDASSLGIDCSKVVTIELSNEMKPRERIKIVYTKKGENTESYGYVTSRIDAPIEMEYYRAGGVLNYVIRRIINGS